MKTLAAAWIAALVLFACAKSEPRAAHGGETNWLKVCDNDDACEQGECVCGVCTVRCSGASQCAGGFSGACTDGERAGLCEDAVDVCLPRCSSDDACGPGFACEDGVCTWLEIAEEDWATLKGEANAQGLESCCHQQGSTGALASTLDSLTRGEERPRASTGVRFNPRAAAACLAVIAENGCLPAKEPFDTTVSRACLRVYERGTLEVGEECVVDWECSEAGAAPTYCGSTYVGDELVFMCEALGVENDLGESCLGACRWGLWCDAETNRCVEPAARGEACITDDLDSCAKGSRCDRSDTGICVAPVPVGEPCDSGEQCEWSACFGGLCREPLLHAGPDCVWDEPDASTTTE